MEAKYSSLEVFFILVVLFALGLSMGYSAGVVDTQKAQLDALKIAGAGGRMPREMRTVS